MRSKNPSVLCSIPAIAGLLAFVPTTSEAAFLFYDGFAAGGTTPSAGQYVSSPASSNGADRDSLVRSVMGAGDGQRPATPGFSTVAGAGGWRTQDGVSSAVYGKVTASGLSYSGLTTVAGAVDIFRTGSNGDATAAQIKNYNRAVTTGLGAGATDLYFSALMQFDAGVRGQVGIAQTSISSIMSFGFNDAGNAVIYGNTSTPAPLGTSTTAYTAGSTYMLVAHVYSGNLVDLYLNPTSLTDQSASAGQKILSGIALNGFMLGTAITDIRLTANTGNNLASPDFIFDEMHGATTWAEAFAVIPEPSTVMLGALAALAGLGRRRR